MRTLAEIKQALHEADREAYEASGPSLAADERKGPAGPRLDASAS